MKLRYYISPEGKLNPAYRVRRLADFKPHEEGSRWTVRTCHEVGLTSILDTYEVKNGKLVKTEESQTFWLRIPR